MHVFVCFPKKLHSSILPHFTIDLTLRQTNAYDSYFDSPGMGPTYLCCGRQWSLSLPSSSKSIAHRRSRQQMLLGWQALLMRSHKVTTTRQMSPLTAHLHQSSTIPSLVHMNIHVACICCLQSRVGLIFLSSCHMKDPSNVSFKMSLEPHKMKPISQ